jgi:lipoic acid synthetase
MNEIKHKPDWIRIKLKSNRRQFHDVNAVLRAGGHVTVCEEAACPNRSECYGCGTATFMIMGDTCTRNCRFCNVKHGKPSALNKEEPEKLAETIFNMKLKYAVITSVDRDDLEDGGAQHFADCISAIRNKNTSIKIEILTPDFRGCLENALNVLGKELPDVFNHNLETIPRLYPEICPSADYSLSLNLLKQFKQCFPNILTKSGLMVGLGETNDEIEQTMKDLREHQVDILTIGQYLQPTKNHIPVDRYVTPEQFKNFEQKAKQMGFVHAASGPLVRSSYYADRFC